MLPDVSDPSSAAIPNEQCQLEAGLGPGPDQISEASDPLTAAFLDALRPVLAAAVRDELERRRASK